MKKRKKRLKIAFFCLFLMIFASACSPPPEEVGETPTPEALEYFSKDGAIFKFEEALKPEQTELAAKKINYQIESHPEIGNVYLSVIPEKSYFDDGSGVMDYDKMVDIIRSSVESAEYIDLFGILSAEDYYRTDSHWRQENILPVAAELCAAMGADAPAQASFTKSLVGEFEGVYARLSGISANPDELYIMESDATKGAIVTSAEIEGELPVYSPQKLGGEEPYDVFLHGAQAVLTIENPGLESGKSLIIFRDSFGSSLAPLLIGSYSKITLVDLRYIMSDFVSEFVDFEGSDVLFIYSTALLNSGGILK